MSKCELCQQPILEEVLSGKVIALDVGHGWNQSAIYDFGAIGNNAKEQELNAKVAYRVKAHLEALGAKVFVLDYSADNSPRLWLREKGRRAGDVKADVFVSIHHNAFDGSAQGSETLVHSQATAADQRLAQMIQAELVSRLKLPNRGVKFQQLGVLSGCPESIPACLSEAFFIDWHGYKGQIPPETLESEALALAIGIRKYLSQA